jgi:uncharacterized membrane protein
MGMIAFLIAKPNFGEKFTEFYILGIDGKADNYPTEFTMDLIGNIIQVQYNDTSIKTNQGEGMLTLGIVNHEEQTEEYSVQIIIDNIPSKVDFGGNQADILTPIKLQTGEKWENAIGFLPTHAGDNQEVDFLLFKGTDTKPANSLRLFINVKQLN